MSNTVTSRAEFNQTLSRGAMSQGQNPAKSHWGVCHGGAKPGDAFYPTLNSAIRKENCGTALLQVAGLALIG